MQGLVVFNQPLRTLTLDYVMNKLRFAFGVKGYYLGHISYLALAVRSFSLPQCPNSLSKFVSINNDF